MSRQNIVIIIVVAVLLLLFGVYFLTKDQLGYTDWPEAMEILQKGQVTSITKGKDGSIILEFADGGMVYTTEPADDSIEDRIKVCGGACTSIELVIR